MTFRWRMLILTLSAAALPTLTASTKVSPKLIWNASASVPIGLYAVRPANTLSVTELVVVKPPEPLAGFLADRGYLPKGVPLLKRVLALPGQIVCRADRTITVDGIAMGDALDRDRRGRPLPAWQGCRTIAEGEVFLMNWQSEDSLDGRYFGLLPAAAITGRADPLWTDEEEKPCCRPTENPPPRRNRWLQLFSPSRPCSSRQRRRRCCRDASDPQRW